MTGGYLKDSASFQRQRTLYLKYRIALRRKQSQTQQSFLKGLNDLLIYLYVQRVYL